MPLFYFGASYFVHFVISYCTKFMVLAYNKVCHLERSRRFSCVSLMLRGGLGQIAVRKNAPKVCSYLTGQYALGLCT